MPCGDDVQADRFQTGRVQELQTDRFQIDRAQTDRQGPRQHPDITRTPGNRFGRDLVEIVPRSLPELFKQHTDQNNSQETQTKMKINISKTSYNFRINPC